MCVCVCVKIAPIRLGATVRRQNRSQGCVSGCTQFAKLQVSSRAHTVALRHIHTHISRHTHRQHTHTDTHSERCQLEQLNSDYADNFAVVARGSTTGTQSNRSGQTNRQRNWPNGTAVSISIALCPHISLSLSLYFCLVKKRATLPHLGLP